eukprot:PhM_4_TR2294/c0_g1_i1/m.70126/K18669/DYRK2_3_4; dual specificity tyrosine-phosphorylation-regulated kinase 2/3/4
MTRHHQQPPALSPSCTLPRATPPHHHPAPSSTTTSTSTCTTTTPATTKVPPISSQRTTAGGNSNSQHRSSSIPTLPPLGLSPRLASQQQQQSVFTPPTPQPATSRVHSDTYLTFLSPYEVREVKAYGVACYYGQNAVDRKIQAPIPGQPNDGFDTEKGDYRVVIGDHVRYRYEILGVLGRGAFGTVLKVLDHVANTPVAMKIIRNRKKFTQQAATEIEVLTHLSLKDSADTVVKLLDSFTFRNHVCIVFELLSLNLYEVMKHHRFKPIKMSLVRKFAVHILRALTLVHDENVIHCDLKPENVVLVQSNRSRCKLIDFGSSCIEGRHVYTYIQSRFYRAPEVILGFSYTRAIDMWSFGCLLVELASGYPLYPGESEYDQLMCIIESLDVPPREIIESSPRRNLFFDQDGLPKLIDSTQKKVRIPNGCPLRSEFLKDFNPEFADFVANFLTWDPAQRPTPEQALCHPYLRDTIATVMRTSPGAEISFVSLQHFPMPPSAGSAAAGGTAVSGEAGDAGIGVTPLKPSGAASNSSRRGSL